ncbi:MAG TPA: 5'/3'-nucleotidase SurE [Acidimicrobiia bacterium]|nr:5'/3'-nucleotidase SurE [Acidimicrobiia bacterium]
MRILVTNDDGIDAPGLVALARALEKVGEITVVVPDRERSWVGKAITRFDPVHVAEVERDGLPMFTVSGYPADAVQLGIHTLGQAPPDLVVSGINLGYNHGAGFLMSSGTVGAAVEAWISGIPAVAVSTGTMGDWHEWRARAGAAESVDDWLRLADVTVSLLDLVDRTGLHAHSDAISINLPFGSTSETERRLTTIARAGYDRLFSVQEDGSYRHAYGGGITQIDPVDGSDIDAAHDGAISITPIRMPTAAVIPERVRQAIEHDPS